MKKTILTTLAAAFFCFGGCYTATAQDAGVAQSDQITGDDGAPNIRPAL